MTREQGNRVILWDLLRSRPLVEPLQSRATLTAAELAPAGRHVILASMDGTSQVWGVAPADFRPLMLERDGPSLAVDFHPNGRQLVVGSRNGMVTLWNVERALAEKSIRQQGAIYSIRFSPDGSRVLGAAHDGTAQVWNVDAGGQFAVRHAQRVIYAEFSPDGRTFVTASFDGTARTWSAEDGAAVSELMRHSGRLWHASFGPDGSWVATAGDDTLRGTDHHARVWDAQTGRAVTLPLRHTQQVYHVAFDPKGTSLASASADNTVAIWTIPAGVRTLTVRHRGPVRHVAFNPTSRYIVSSSQDNTAQIWDLETGLPVGEAMHHPREVLFAEWRPDGRRVVTACGDGAVRMWDPTTGRPTSEPLQHHGMVGHPRFSPDGRRLACPAPQVCIWELPTIDGIPPVWLPDLAESVAGTRLNGRNTKKETFPGGLFELGQELMAAADSEPMIPWARWIFEERFKIDPGNRVARHAGSEGGAEQLSRESVIAAIHIDPADASHWFQLSRMTRSARPQDNPQRDAQAEYFHRKAAMLAPESLDEWLERLEWLQTSGDIDRLARNFSDALSLHPANIELRWRHAQWLEQSGRQLEALDGYHRVVALETNRTTIRFFRSAQRRKALRSQFGNAAAAQSEWQNTVNVASRSDDLPRSSVDLAAHYNAALHEPWHDRKRAGNDFSQLVPGRFEVGGTVFDIRGIIQLGGIYLDSVEPGYPGAVRGIAIDRPCEALHFLHGAGWGSTEPEGTAVGRYVVHYADGIEETIPLHVGTDLLEWFQQGPQPLADLAGAKTIDMGRNGAGIPVRLFLRSWRNPRPTVPIASVDFESAGTGVAPFLVALTTEP
ncbi:MAG TPA: hypothetical protein DCY13_02230, partial [Verrucomicrobiales bacterium]|nr:hypothetical protein [Verrucomicrobiales bacterium]